MGLPTFGGRLRIFASDAAVYGVAHVLTRLLTLILVPVHTDILTPAEYGPIGALYGYIVVFTVCLTFGLETAYLRFAASSQATNQRDVFSTPTLFIGLVGLSTATVVTVYRDGIAGSIGLEGLGHFVAAAAWIVVLDSLPIVALAWLRLHDRARVFAAIRVTSLVLYFVLNLVLLTRLRHGAFGVLEANLAASASEVVLLTPVFATLLRFRIQPALLRKLLGFSLPLVPAGLVAVALQFADRPILQKLASDAEVGIYQANSKLAFPMLLLVTVFHYAWQPFFLSRSDDEDARPLFARMLVYQTAAAFVVFLMISLFADIIVAIPVGGGRTLINRQYWAGLEIVPWLLLAYAALGIYQNLGAGPTLRERTGVFLRVSVVAAVVHLGLAIVLVRWLGMIGVAYATCIASMALAAGMWFLSHRVYPLEHEWGRLTRIGCGGLVPWLLFQTLGGAEVGVWPRLALLLMYPLVLVMTGFFREDEIAALRSAFTPRRSTSG